MLFGIYDKIRCRCMKRLFSDSNPDQVKLQFTVLAFLSILTNFSLKSIIGAIQVYRRKFHLAMLAELNWINIMARYCLVYVHLSLE